MPFTLGPRAASAGYRLSAFDRIGSTNAQALSAARAGERGPVWFVTSEQTAGRGRRSRPWIAPRGNLASSLLDVMQVTPATAATLGFAAAVALERALRRLSVEAAPRPPGPAGPKLSLKWPNDVLAGEKKLAGILLEVETGPAGLAVVVGIGTNVIAAPTDTPTPATSMKAAGIEASAERLFAELSDDWAELHGIWDRGGGFGEIRKLWLARAAGLGQAVAIRSGDDSIEGTFETIDEQGCMMVRTKDGRELLITAGEVYFGSVASMGAT